MKDDLCECDGEGHEKVHESVTIECCKERRTTSRYGAGGGDYDAGWFSDCRCAQVE